MKKINVILLISLFILLIAVFGVLKINNGTLVSEELSTIEYQNSKIKDYECYGYTIDNPNIIINPYNNSPLSALIAFQTDEYVEVKVTIKGKHNDDYSYYVNKEKDHYIPIYYLYPDYLNSIILSYSGINKTINIKTNSLPQDLNILEYNSVTNDLYFETKSNYLYAYDNNSEIRFIYTNSEIGNITKMNNNHFIISNDQKINDISSTGVVEIDLLGKIYYEYLLKDNYYGQNSINNNKIIALSKKKISIDRQNSDIEATGLEIIANSDVKLDTNINYFLKKGITFGNLIESKQSATNVMLLNYKSIDSKYKKYNIVLKKEGNRFLIKGDFNKKDKVFLIFDRIFGKRVYELTNNYLYVNETNLSSEYTIYIKINNDLYKTDKSVKF